MAISVEALQQRVQQAFPGDSVNATGDGYHFQLTVVSEQFDGLRTVQRQQKVYAIVNDWIANGELHALTMKTLTPSEAAS